MNDLSLRPASAGMCFAERDYEAMKPFFDTWSASAICRVNNLHAIMRCETESWLLGAIPSFEDAFKRALLPVALTAQRSAWAAELIIPVLIKIDLQGYMNMLLRSPIPRTANLLLARLDRCFGS